MVLPRPFEINYVTKNQSKMEEIRIFEEKATVRELPVRELFKFNIWDVSINETLEVDIATLVTAEVREAYKRIQVPCIVEHAGLIFEDYADKSYPGGLTKPMWNTLGDRFLEETRSLNRRAVARAVIAYCDGMSIKTFTGETKGKLSDSPRGSRKFYWDTVFIPDDSSSTSPGKTYAEIVDDLGIDYKVLNLSQSSRAMKMFLEYLLTVGTPRLWS